MIPIARRIFHIVVYVLTFLVSVPLVVSLLLRNPEVQTMVSKMAAAFLSRQINNHVEIGEINMNIRGTFFLDSLVIEDERGHNMLSVGRLEARLNRISVRNRVVGIGMLNLKGVDFELRKYHNKDLNNLAYFLQHFQSQKVDTSQATPSRPWTIRVRNLRLRNTHFVYENEDKKQPGPGIDFADIELLDMDLLMNRVKIHGDTISGEMQNMVFVEKSGFELREFSGNIYFSPHGLKVDRLKLMTNQSDLDLDLAFDYKDLQAFNDFINAVKLDVTFRESELEMSDIGYFAPTMLSMTDRIHLKGDVQGTVSSLSARNFEVDYGNNTRFSGDIRMNGLPDITETFIHANIGLLTATADDVRTFKLPGDAGSIHMPDLLAKMGKIKVHGKFTGFYNDFVSRAEFRSPLGRLNTDIILKTVKGENTLTYEGRLQASQLDVGKLLNVDSLGKTSFVLNVDGRGVKPENLKLVANGRIHSLEFLGYNYRNIVVDGQLEKQVFEGAMSVSDENLDFSFNGLVDFQARPRFNFKARVNKADLFALKLTNRDSTANLSTHMDIDFYASNLDNIHGMMRFDSTTYIEGDSTYFLDSLIVKARASENSGTRFTVASELFDVDVHGNYQVSKLAPAITQYIGHYSDVLVKDSVVKQKKRFQQQLQFDILLRKPAQLTSLFVPGLHIAAGTGIRGRFDADSASLNIEGHSDLINYTGIKGYNWRLNTRSDSTAFNLDMQFSKLMFKERSESDSSRIGIDSLTLQAGIRADTIRYAVTWNDLSNQQTNLADIEGRLSLINQKKFTTAFTKVDLLIDSTRWTVDTGNRIVYDTSGIFFRNVQFYSDTSSFTVDGGISHNTSDSLRLVFRDVNISHVDQLLANRKIDVDGILNGRATLVNLYANPNFLVDIQMDSLSFNQARLGTLRLDTHWEDAAGRLRVNLDIISHGNIGTSKTLSITGDYYPQRTDQNFDLTVNLQNLGTRMFNPFVEQYINIDPESLASGKLHITGSYSKPVAEGKINLMRTQFLVKYLNTTYSAAGSLEVSKNDINVSQLTLYDARRRSATVSGDITHNYFRDFALDIHIQNENFRALNTTASDNELFYGTAVASGKVDITGPIDNILMNISARTEEGTRIMIPISAALNVSKNDFIIFINNADSAKKEQPSYSVSLKGLTMNFDLEVTPDADIQIFLPYSMGNIRGSGSGEISLGITPHGDFTINGDYVISDGEFFFTLENLIGREFNIREGSKISWTGSPYDATVDITATYDVKTTLDGLRLQTDSTAVYNTRVQVECVIDLQNALFNPDIRFSIDFSNVADDTKQIIYASLDTTDQSAMSQQIVSLLVLGSFSYTTAGPNIGATGFKLLSNQLSDWLNKISKDFDIGINYQPGTKLTEDELEVALRTQLFNDRLSIDGNFGVRGTSASQNTSSVVGDINVEYKITNDGRFRIKAFNRTNDISFLEDNAPYTQGVGVFYRKEFENFGDLFGGKDKKDKKKKDQSQNRNKKAVQESARGDEE